jgi:hypothetical protein
MNFHLVPLLLLLGPGLQQPPPPQPPPTSASAAVAAKPAQPARKLFNETADAKAQVASAIAAAAEDGIRVLLVFGSNDDERSANWPKIQRAQEIAGPRFFSDEYKVVYIDVGKADKNLDVASSYGMKIDAASLPAFAVLDEKGTAVTRASAAEFPGADAVSLDAKKVAAFLAANQAAPPPDPEPQLKAAVSQAKKDGKYVFLWFSAPW